MIFKDHQGAIYENIFSLNIGPDYEGKTREIDVKILAKVDEMIRSNNEQYRVK